MRLKRILNVAVASIALVGLAATVAEAQTRKSRAAATLTIKKRSFLDSGPVVPVGSLRNYVNVNTTLAVPTYSNIGPSGFGSQALPQRFEVPGRSSPLFTF
jgi:hypothetical protein